MGAGGRRRAQPFGSVDAALSALRAGDIDGAMVPIENSVEGGVSATLDALASGEPLVVTGEVLVPVTFVLAAPAGTSRDEVRAVGTHSHAWAQVRGWMAEQLPDAVYVPTLSTAAAAEGLEPSADSPTTPRSVRPPPRVSTGSRSSRTTSATMQAAVTRFVLVARPGDLPAPTGADKTTLVLFQREDHAGGLLELLEQFAARGINMTRLESRPTKESMGRTASRSTSRATSSTSASARR